MNCYDAEMKFETKNRQGVLLNSLVWFALGLALVLVAGCSPPQPKLPPQPNLRIDLLPVDKAAFDRVIFENTGRVVLVNFWAMWDESSMRQLAHMKVLQEVYGHKGLQVVLVSLDDAASSESVTQFLQAMRSIGLTYLISVNGAQPKSFAEFEIEDDSLPYFVLYDRMGNRVKTYTGPTDGIEQEIETLIRQTDFDSATPERN